MPKQLTSFAAECARDAQSACSLQVEGIALLKIVLLALKTPQDAFSSEDWLALSVAVGAAHDNVMHAYDVTVQIVESAKHA